MRYRPGLVADYRSDVALFRSNVQRFWFVMLLVAVVVLGLGGTLPLIPGLVDFSLTGDLLLIAVSAVFASVGAIGLNIVTGFAGQVSLGHAFFLGVGAFTGAVLGGTEVTRQVVDLMKTFELGDMLLVLGGHNSPVELSARNLQAVTVLQPEGVNVYDVLLRDNLVLTKDAVAAIAARLGV